MSFTDRIIKAIFDGDDNLDMTIGDIRKSTIQEILLYHAYCTVCNKKWYLDFSKVPHTIDGKCITFESDHDVLVVAYFITQSVRDIANVSNKTARRIIKYSTLYETQFDKRIRRLSSKLDIDFESNGMAETRKRLILDIHGAGNNPKSAMFGIE